jgi:hypothetical protein
MKKIMLLALALVISSASLFAASGDKPIEANKELRNQIVDLLKTPQFTVEEDMNITLTFTFSSSGEIVVLDIDSRHRDLLNYVRKHLNYKILNVPGNHNQIYVMPLKIKTG